jgi:hypothetical protein
LRKRALKGKGEVDVTEEMELGEAMEVKRVDFDMRKKGEALKLSLLLQRRQSTLSDDHAEWKSSQLGLS